MNRELDWPKSLGSASAEAVAELEAAHACRLPADFVEFLRTQNGGAPTPGRFDAEGWPEPLEVGMLLGLGELPGYMNLLSHRESYEHLAPAFIPIGYESGGSPLLLRLHPPDTGAVLIWDEELDKRGASGLAGSLSKVANSFAEFLSILK